MAFESSKATCTVTPVIGRCFWAVMGIAHTPALIGAWGSFLEGGMKVSSLGGCVFLTASMLFFALKLYGVHFLRFHPGRRSILALVLVVGLIHFDCLRPAFASAGAEDCVAIIATTSLVGVAVLASKRWPASVHSKIGTGLYFLPRRFSGRILIESFDPRCWVLALGLFRLRAPPC